jgi:hypothetical protein
VNGKLIELWMLKALCGHFFTDTKMQLSAGEATPEEVAKMLDMSTPLKALLYDTWLPGAGLYAQVNPIHERFDYERGIRITFFFRKLDNACAGVSINMLGLLDLHLILVPPDAPDWLKDGLVPRPYQIRFRNGKREGAIFLAWPSGTEKRSVIIGY